MISITPNDISTGELHGYLLGAIAPRPIAFASTVDSDGNVNLSPFSFFNVFSANPPIVVFSPARRVRGNTVKHTLENAIETKEVCINIVSYAMVQQMSLSSTDYGKDINEFDKAGFTELSSEIIKPPRVAESPFQMECKVNEIISLGNEGGAGNLIICEVVKLHMDENILDADGKIDPNKIDTVARMGGNWYNRSKKGMFEVPKPLSKLGIGVDNLPKDIRESKVLTGNDLGMLANVEEIPSYNNDNLFKVEKSQTLNSQEEIHKRAQSYLCEGKLEEAWNILLFKK